MGSLAASADRLNLIEYLQSSLGDGGSNWLSGEYSGYSVGPDAVRERDVRGEGSTLRNSLNTWQKSWLLSLDCIRVCHRVL
jgi:hypothetical protein